MQKKYNLDLPISSNNTSILKLSTDLSNVKITMMATAVLLKPMLSLTFMEVNKYDR